MCTCWATTPSSITPPVILLGNENDFYFAQDEGDYLNWISAYNQAYDAIKLKSADTLVGPVFNFEHLSGTGTFNGWNQANWGALDLHDLNRVAVVAITTSPWLEHADPAMIPVNHLQPLVERIPNTAIILSEIAWPAKDAGQIQPPWSTTPEAQSRFVKRIPDWLEQAPVLGMIWPWLHKPVNLENQMDWDLFAGISLFDADGNPRPALAEWLLMLDRVFQDRFMEK